MKRPSEQAEVAKRVKSTNRVVVGWFRNDLRLKDNPMLETVARMAEEGTAPAMLVWIADPRFYDPVTYGRVTDMEYKKSISTRMGGREHLAFASRKCDGRRARFYLNVLRDLQRGLQELGTELLILSGKPEDLFADLSKELDSSLDVVCLREPVSPEWTDVEDFTEEALKACGGSLTRLWGAMSLYHEEDLPFKLGESPGSYTGVARALGWVDIWTSAKHEDYAAPIRQPIPAPTVWAAKAVSTKPKGAWDDATFQDDKAAMTRLGYSEDEVANTLKSPHGGSRKGKGGETSAWTRFEAWMAKEPELEQAAFADWDLPTSGTQKDASLREGEVDALQWKNLSKAHGWMQLSKYLACGCISPRSMYHELAEKGHWALAGVCHRFMWREWHRFNAIKFHRRLFWLQGPGRQNQIWKTDPEAAERWKTGNTGVPYIDACIRELNQTGWLAYKGRKTVAAFLSIDCWLDWRIGAFHFEEMLLDYDVAMNYGNWVTCVRVDKDYWGQSFRSPTHEDLKLKIAAEATNDPDGSYIKQWVPELRAIPTRYIQTPWMMSDEERSAANFVLGKDYPAPMLPEAKLQFIAEDLGKEQSSYGADESWAAQGSGSSPLEAQTVSWS
eukprot:TRINITY_DN14994_c1_g1_i2.p1 TRINITY_DN14994_c1_g1~~TRINITY_DN14994_c1_g1_i2.p1  ORF type:complete len:614 (+),score=134.28 TRINITY_DN14994_c1_g1_i2:147-1988(+)